MPSTRRSRPRSSATSDARQKLLAGAAGVLYPGASRVGSRGAVADPVCLSEEAIAMKHPSASIAVSLCAAMALGAGICLAAPSPSDATSDAIPQGYLWQHHAVQVNFMGYTSTYTCDGMEGKVRDILRYLGARKDITVHAQGCPRGPDSLERLIWLNIEFDALAPAPAGTATTDLVPAQWQAIQIDSQRPFFMGEGDCELLAALKPM